MEILKASMLYKMIESFIKLIESQITNSRLYKIFTKDFEKGKDGFFESILYKIIGFLRLIFEKLKLDKLFSGSIFAKTYIFIAITIALPLPSTTFVPQNNKFELGSFLLFNNSSKHSS